VGTKPREGEECACVWYTRGGVAGAGAGAFAKLRASCVCCESGLRRPKYERESVARVGISTG
jgi:hypothetical protein